MSFFKKKKLHNHPFTAAQQGPASAFYFNPHDSGFGHAFQCQFVELREQKGNQVVVGGVDVEIDKTF